MEILKKIASFIWSIKGKLILAVLLIPVFILVLFPVDDVSDLVTKQVSQATNNQIYVSFDHMDLGLLPSPSVGFDSFSLEAGPMPPLAIRRLDVNPSLMGLLLGSPSAAVSAQGILRGDINASVKPGKKLENGATTQDISIDAQRINLQELRKMANLPIKIKGQMNLKVDGYVEPAFTAQPDLSLDLSSPSVEMQSTTLETALGPIVLPGLKLGRLNLKGRLSAGQFLIEDGNFGKEGDEISGNVKGRISVELRNLGGRIVPIPGNYEIRLDMTAKDAFYQRNQTLFLLIDNFKAQEAGQVRYRVVVSGNPMSIPKFQPMR